MGSEWGREPMPRRIPTVNNRRLIPLGRDRQPLPPIPLDTPAWQAWLADGDNRSFAFQGVAGALTARREARAGADYWYGYRTVAGRLRKVYLGRGADLTLARLEAAARELAAPPALPAADPPEARPILATRLVPPPLRAGVIPRPRLEQLLGAGLSGALTLLVAPAGFGKTTLLVGWLAALSERQRPLGGPPSPPRVAWLTLDPADDHPAQLLRDLVAALRGAVPDLGAAALASLERRDGLGVAPTQLVNEFAARLPPCLLILDEYHLLGAPAAHELIGFLLEHLPPALHLVIAAREQPPLPLARLRVRGLVSELGAGDLRFTPAESAAWLRSQVSPDLSEADLAALERHTEGWAAAIQLATLALRGRPNPGALITALASSEHLIADYLAEEVLAALSPATYAFVLRSAILEQLCAELCAAVLAADDPRPLQLLLEELERRNLFLLPLDAGRRWFRFHPLFAAVLRRRLARELDGPAVAELHRRAAAWLATAGLTDQAIAHALAAGQHRQAGALIAARSLGDLIGAIPQPTVHAWLTALPEEVLRANPRLCLLQSWLLLERHDLAGSARWLRHAEEARPVDGPGGADSRGEIILLDLASRLFRGDARNVAAAQRALEQLPAGDGELTGLIHLLTGMAAFAGGDWAQAHATFLAAGREARQAGSSFLHTAAGLSQACVELALGDLAAAGASCRRLLGALPDHGPLGDLSTLLQLLAQEVAREQGYPPDPAAAAALAAVGARLGDLDGRFLAGTLMVRAGLSCGDGDLAQREAETLMRLAKGERRPLVAETAAALCAQVALHREDLPGAAGWLQTAPAASASAQALPMLGAFLWETCVLVPIQLQLAQAQRGGDHTGWRAAREQIARGEAGTGLTWGLRVRLRALRALAHGGLGEYGAALQALREALALATPGGFVAPFRELGPELQALCAALRRTSEGRPEDEAALHRLSLLLDSDEATPRQENGSPAAPLTPEPHNPAPLAEPLTARERQVLGLLAEGASNRAIAARLILSEGTVKGYVHAIFGKLSARSRTEAVARARFLGLL